MNTVYCKRRTQNRYPHRNYFLTALFTAVMVMILNVPAFAVEVTASKSAPETEVSTSTPGLVENPADEDGALPGKDGISEPIPMPPPSPVSTLEELPDAIAHASENDVIEFDAAIQTPPELTLGRADCPVTIRRAASEAHFIIGEPGAGNIKVQNITFDGAEIPSCYRL